MRCTSIVLTGGGGNTGVSLSGASRLYSNASATDIDNFGFGIGVAENSLFVMGQTTNAITIANCSVGIQVEQSGRFVNISDVAVTYTTCTTDFSFGAGAGDVYSEYVDAANDEYLIGGKQVILNTDPIDLTKWTENVGTVATTGSDTLNTDLYTYFYNTATTGSLSLSFSTTAPAGKLVAITLELFGLGTNAPTWVSNVEWPDGTEPTWSTGVDIVSFSTRDGGTTWYGYHAGGAFA